MTPSKSISSGWTPQVKTDYGAEGEVKIEATLYTIVSIEVGAFILDKYKISGSLNDKPEAVFTAEAKGTTNNEGIEGNPTCKLAVSIGAKLRNTLYVEAEAFGKKTDPYNLIEPYESPSLGKEICAVQK